MACLSAYCQRPFRARTGVKGGRRPSRRDARTRSEASTAAPLRAVRGRNSLWRELWLCSVQERRLVVNLQRCEGWTQGPSPSPGSGRGRPGRAGCRASLRADEGMHGALRPQPDGLNHMPRPRPKGVMPFGELACWLCPVRLTRRPRPWRGYGSRRRAGRSYGRNAKLVIESVLVCDVRGSGIYVRADHRKFGARRTPLRSEMSTEKDRSV